MPGSIIGAAVKRVEDPRFIRGEGQFIPNLRRDDAVHAAMVRSAIPHGRLNGIDTSPALSMDGVVGVFTAANLDLPPIPRPTKLIPEGLERPVLARDAVRFVGELVAVVVAETARQAEDAASLVFADIEPLPAVESIERAIDDDAPQIWPDLDGNVVRRTDYEPIPNLFAGADVVVELEMRNQRLAAVPMETNGTLAVPTSDGIEIWLGSQNAFGHRRDLTKILELEEDQTRVIVPDMGGGFGAKFPRYPEQAAVAAIALVLGRPVRWHETRRDNLAAMYHGRAQLQRARVGATRDGRIVGLQATVYQDTGAYPAFGIWLPRLTRLMASGTYDIPNIDVNYQCVVTNTTPTDAYRGAGRPEATAMVERIVDRLAVELDMDPAELRRRNYIPPFDAPQKTALGARYDSGDYPAALETALARVGYDELRREQAERRRRRDPVLLGIGLASYVEVTAPLGDKEWSSVEVRIDGTIVVKVGTLGHGQGHDTAYRQLIAELFKVPFEQVELVQGDTGRLRRGAGTGGSRSLQIGGSSVRSSSEDVIDKASRIVANHLEANVDDIVVFDNATIGVAGVPNTGLTWGAVARLAADEAALPAGEEPGLYAEAVFEQDDGSYPFGTHISVVEVDTDTGAVTVLRHVAVDDCGNILNPVLVDGQVHGGIAQGVGQALLEEFSYDEDANPLTGTLMSYLIPTAGTLPSFEVEHTYTESPLNPLGVKGIGEAPTIGSTVAVQNAVVDAVAHLGVRHIDMPATSSTVWSAIRQAERRE